MKTVPCRPGVNALTMPQSYSVRHIPRDTVGYGGVADRVARKDVLDVRVGQGKDRT
jgi:hypothetical protein